MIRQLCMLIFISLLSFSTSAAQNNVDPFVRALSLLPDTSNMRSNLIYYLTLRTAHLKMR